MASILVQGSSYPHILAMFSQLPSICNGIFSVRKASSSWESSKSSTNNCQDSNPLQDTPLFKELELINLSSDTTASELVKLLNSAVKPESKWNKVYSSSHSFFENKNGFSRDRLEAPHQKLFYVLATPSSNLLRQNILNPVAVQKRGFKTARAGRITGLGKDESKSKISELAQNYNFMFSDSQKEETSKASEFLQHKDQQVEGKLKIAFAEGYNAGKGNSSKSNRQFGPKHWLAALAVVLNLYLFYRIMTFARQSGFDGLLLGKDKLVRSEDINVTFDNVMGVDEAKDELKEVVEFLRNPQKFTTLGAKLPKGVLLIGPPGIGKTLLARAVAGEAGVPFYHSSGSEFDEVFVGTGAKRIRQLFKAAKMTAPCVIFIDEIDAVGSKRTSSQIHPFANQTINQLLSEMDGFVQNAGVIVLGATNKKENLDSALLRPGRFDVEVNMFVPDLKGRRDIIQLYVNKVTCDSSVDVEMLAKGTRGFTGADIENMINQAALKAAIDGKESISMIHMEFARDKVLMGPEKKTRIADENTNWSTAYHEAGHTLVAHFTKHATPLHKVTIIPRGRALGYTAFLEDKDVFNYTKAQLLAQMDVAMGGRVAEELIYGTENVTTGASDDFTKATAIAASMVEKFGMSEKVGTRVFQDQPGAQSTQDLVDSEIKRILQESYDRAKNILKSHTGELKELASALVKYETLDKDEIKSIVDGKHL